MHRLARVLAVVATAQATGCLSAPEPAADAGPGSEDGAAGSKRDAGDPCSLGPWSELEKVPNLSQGPTGATLSDDQLVLVRDNAGVLQLADRPTPQDDFTLRAVLGNVNADDAMLSNPALSGDGTMLLYTREDGGNADIYLATRDDVDSVFGAGQPVAGLDDPALDEAAPAIVERAGAYEVYYHLRDGDDDLAWATCLSLDVCAAEGTLDALNGPDSERSPTVRGDGLEIVYAVLGQQTVKSARRDDVDAAFVVDAMPVFTPDAEIERVDPHLSADGTTLYVSVRIDAAPFTLQFATRTCAE